MSSKQDVERILDEAKRQGFAVIMGGGGHWKVSKNGALVMSASATPSDNRAPLNYIAKLRQHGFVWPPVKEAKVESNGAKLTWTQKVLTALSDGEALKPSALYEKTGALPQDQVNVRVALQVLCRRGAVVKQGDSARPAYALAQVSAPVAAASSRFGNTPHGQGMQARIRAFFAANRSWQGTSKDLAEKTGIPLTNVGPALSRALNLQSPFVRQVGSRRGPNGRPEVVWGAVIERPDWVKDVPKNEAEHVEQMRSASRTSAPPANTARYAVMAPPLSPQARARVVRHEIAEALRHMALALEAY